MATHCTHIQVIIIIIITCICVQWVAMVFLVHREGMQLPLVATVLREASALMRISSYCLPPFWGNLFLSYSIIYIYYCQLRIYINSAGN